MIKVKEEGGVRVEIVKKGSAALLLAILALLDVLPAEGEAKCFGLLRLAVDGFTDDLIALPHIQVVLHRSPNIPHAIPPRPILNLPLIHPDLQIAFVSDEQEDGIGTLGPGCLVPLGGGGEEGGGTGEVEDEHDALAAVEVGSDDGAVLLLTGSVPDEELDSLPVDGHLLDLEVYGRDRGTRLQQELTLHVLPEERSLPHGLVADHDYLVMCFIP